MKKILLFILATIVAVIVGLTTHIYILRLTDPILAKLSMGHVFPRPEEYTFNTIFWAYVTAIEQMTVIAAIYYFTADLLKIGRFLKIMLLSIILLELKGDLFRMTVMHMVVAHTVGVSHPILFGVATQFNQWAATLLLVTALVFICPIKKYNMQK